MTTVDHYELYAIYKSYSSLSSEARRSAFCKKKNLLSQIMEEIELMCGKIMRNLRNMSCLVDESATHPLYTTVMQTWRI